MDCLQAIHARHSYRGPYTDAAVPQTDLIEIVKAGIQAPSGNNDQTTSFVIVTAPDTLKQIATIAPDSKALATCQALVAVVMASPDEIPAGHGFFGHEDYAAAVENMLLAITALGYASVWLDGVLRSNNNARFVGELLGVPSEKEVCVLLPVGVPAEPLTDRGRKPFEERTRWERW